MSAPFPESICHRCQALKTVKGAHSVFLMCTALPVKYPAQPVVKCQAFVPVANQQLKPER